MSSCLKCLKFSAAIVFFVFHIMDIATDIIACISYKNEGFDHFYKATLAFIIIPFVYIVFGARYETGGFTDMSFCGSTGVTLACYCLGPLFPFVFKGKISDDNLVKAEGFGLFGSGYMEDIPQVIIALFFLFSRANADTPERAKMIALIQLGFSALSGIYKLVSGSSKIGGGVINCCGSNCRIGL